MIEDASSDPEFRDHPGRLQYGIESYIAVPLFRRTGARFGTLCALDPDPASLSRDSLEIFQLLADLIALRLEEEDRSRDRETFIGVLGHDLRNPLNSVSLNTQALLARSDVPAAARSFLHRNLQAVRRMNGMVEDLMDFARGRLGDGIQITRRPFDLGATIDRVVGELESDARERGVSIERVCETPLIFSGDERRLAQVLSNLISNAVAHSPDDAAIQVGARDREATLVITVTNQGRPIPEELTERLFQPFVGRESPRSSSSGLGLGLYIVAEIVGAHGGRIDVESGSGIGTTFRVVLPREAADDG